MKKLLLLSALCCAAVSTTLFGQLEVKPGNQPPFTPENLVTNFMTSGGINVLNVTYNGAAQAVGFFTGGDSIIGLERGLILTSGSAASNLPNTVGAGENGSLFASTSNNSNASEPHLAAISSPLYDVAYYTITFQSYSDSIRFRYVFASEEYPEFACTQYNDVFGFFLEGPGYATALNIAQIPGTNLPVTINNIHPLNLNSPNCNPAFEQFYNANDTSSNQPTYDGVLDPFVAEAAVEPCGIYTMTIAIADVGDHVYDSGVFLEANSFGSTPFVEASFGPGNNVLPEESTALPVSLTFSQIPASILPLTVSFAGDAVQGTDYSVAESTYTISTSDTVLQFTVQPIADTLPELVETVVVNISGGSCFIQTFDLYIADPGIIFKNADTLNLTGTLTLGGDIVSSVNTVFTYSNDTDFPIEPVNAMVVSGINVQAIPLDAFIDPSIIESVCLNINHQWISDINVFLKAPGGSYMELTTGNGGSGDNYTGTCFSPAATQPVNYGLPFAPAAAAPFTGLFQPEGQWSDLTGGSINGIWQLVVSDDANGFTGTLTDWSITFNMALGGSFNYLWSTGATTQTIDVNAPGNYSVTVSNTVSTFSKTYFVKPACGFSSQNFTLCQGESVAVNGIIYDENNSSGSQTFTVSPGCDSVLFVNVQFLPAIESTVNASICNGDFYTFGNEELYLAGTYQHTFTASNGCDSLVTLHLDVRPAYFNGTQKSICEGEAYVFGNQTLTTSGVYQKLFQASNGCDSVVVLQLHVLPNATDSIFVVLQLGEVFEAGGMQFNEFGDFVVNLQAANGCDSTLFIHIDIVDGVNNSDISQLVTISPNPARGVVNIQWPADLNFEQLTVRSADQRTIYTQRAAAHSGNAVIDVSHWQSGLYLIELNGASGNVIRKLIKI